MCHDKESLFAKNKSMKLIKLTKAALKQHVERLEGHVWRQLLLASLILLPPTSSRGWIKMAGGAYEPYWTKMPETS